MCFGGGSPQTVYQPPAEPEKVPPRTDPASRVGKFDEEFQPVNAYGEPLGKAESDQPESARSTRIPYIPASTVKRF